MGKGDIKTGKGKRINGSYGNTRKRKKATSTAPVVTAKKDKEVVKKAPAKKAAEAKPAAAKPAAAKKAPAKKTTKKTEE
jgi:ribosomal small subunit protein bTHX